MNYIETTLGALLREQASRFPDRDFIIYSDRNLRFTYGEFDQRVNDLAKGFLSSNGQWKNPKIQTAGNGTPAG